MISSWIFITVSWNIMFLTLGEFFFSVLRMRNLTFQATNLQGTQSRISAFGNRSSCFNSSYVAYRSQSSPSASTMDSHPLGKCWLYFWIICAHDDLYSRAVLRNKYQKGTPSELDRVWKPTTIYFITASSAVFFWHQICLLDNHVKALFSSTK